MSHDDSDKPVEDNIVSMPVKNMKKVLHKEFVAQKRIAAMSSFVVFLAVFGLINNFVWQEGDSSTSVNSRGIASVGTEYQRTYDKEFEQAMLAELHKSKDIEFARVPNSLDQLNYGVLKGQYSFRLKNGKVRSLELSEAVSRAEAKYRKSSLDFLITHSKHLPLKYDRVDKTSGEIVDGLTHETYDLINGGKTVGKAHFKHNREGGLVSFQVE